MKKQLFDTTGTWYKGNLHMHTTDSDGQLTPDEALECYHNAGYDFVAITDHWKVNKERDYKGMLVVSGVEYDTGDMINSKIFHIVASFLKEDPQLTKDRTRNPQEIIDTIKRAGGIAVLAHPAWSVTDPWSVLKLHSIDASEVWNSISDIPYRNARRADSSIYFDLWAEQGCFVRAVAGDDAHWYKGEHVSSFTMVNAKECTADSLRSAIEAGNFYASQGPLFDEITFDGNTFEVKAQNAETAVFVSNSVWSDSRVQKLDNGYARYTVTDFDKYIRIELRDKDGKLAWSSPYQVR